MYRSALSSLGAVLLVPTLLALPACDAADPPEDTAPPGLADADEANQEARNGTDANGAQRRTAEPGAGADAASESGADEARAIPQGTVMTLRLDETISTRTHEAGDEFTAVVTQAVRNDSGVELVPEGADVVGVVEESRGSSGPEEEAILAFRLESLQLDGSEHPLQATVQRAEPSRTEGDTGAETAAKIAIGTAAGALIGQVLGEDTESTLGGAAAGTVAGAVVALSTRGGAATLEEGATFRIQLDERVPLEN